MIHTKHPNQPVIREPNGVIRFKRNHIVQYLLDNGKIDLNTLARIPFDNDDRNQFAQLIGYSVTGFGELDYADPERVEWADEQAEQLMKVKE